jgi:hypothetical protein
MRKLYFEFLRKKAYRGIRASEIGIVGWEWGVKKVGCAIGEKSVLRCPLPLTIW